MKVNGSKTGLVLAGIVFVGLAGVSATAASFQGLGDLPGGSFRSKAYAVSADGSVVVGEGRSASSRHEAFRWTDATGMVGLGYLPGGGFESKAYAVSADGSVVVGEGSSASGRYEAFRWTDLNNNGLVDPNEKLDYNPQFALEDLPGGNFRSEAYGVSADGSVVVGYGTSASGREAFRWTDLNGNGLVDPNEKLDNHPEFGLGSLPDGIFNSVAYSVSADGSAVVGESESASGDEAFRWTDLNGNGLVDPNEKLDNHPEFGLGDLPGGIFSSLAMDVSADGSVAVGESVSASGDEAFRWEGGEMVGLGDLLGGDFWSEAYGVSADGSVVVGEGSSASGREAFIWDATNGIRSLKDVLESDFGLDLTGWTLKEARAISDDGSTIVGYGTSPSGNEAWIATLGCDYNLAGDMNDDCRVELTDFAQLGAGWQISYDMLDLKEMAASWLIDCDQTPGDPACVPKGP